MHSLATCAALDAACTYLVSDCGFLVDEYAAPVAGSIAKCWVKVQQPGKCRTKKMDACILQAVRAAAIDHATAAICDSEIADCKREKRRIPFTRDQCVSTLSALSKVGREGAIVGLHPAMEEGVVPVGCTLANALPMFGAEQHWDYSPD